eukprot:CAMPEP_0172649736 /NCGR_PEP_ID=MMETSP1068-20121228/241940_1 /TAXON_ID=35684 /ORGANISM="Pseudopedinella elastica, Strain CCMP716" /LENGTH=800 /DNA_ID=CAMNT_0013464095 /DNA_START=58 /DNA_END=2458 /DNA_ORIENTATION=-
MDSGSTKKSQATSLDSASDAKPHHGASSVAKNNSKGKKWPAFAAQQDKGMLVAGTLEGWDLLEPACAEEDGSELDTSEDEAVHTRPLTGRAGGLLARGAFVSWARVGCAHPSSWGLPWAPLGKADATDAEVLLYSLLVLLALGGDPHAVESFWRLCLKEGLDYTLVYVEVAARGGGSSIDDEDELQDEEAIPARPYISNARLKSLLKASSAARPPKAAARRCGGALSRLGAAASRTEKAARRPPLEPARADKFGAHAGSQEAPPAPPAFEAGDISKAVPGGADAAVVRMEPDSLTLQVRAQPPMPSTPPAAAAAAAAAAVFALQVRAQPPMPSTPPAAAAAAAAAAARVSKYGGGSRFVGGVWAAGLAAPPDAAAMLAPPIKKVLPPVTKGGPARTYKRHFWELLWPSLSAAGWTLEAGTRGRRSDVVLVPPGVNTRHAKVRVDYFDSIQGVVSALGAKDPPCAAAPTEAASPAAASPAAASPAAAAAIAEQVARALSTYLEAEAQERRVRAAAEEAKQAVRGALKRPRPKEGFHGDFIEGSQGAGTPGAAPGLLPIVTSPGPADAASDASTAFDAATAASDASTAAAMYAERTRRKRPQAQEAEVEVEAFCSVERAPLLGAWDAAKAAGVGSGRKQRRRGWSGCPDLADQELCLAPGPAAPGRMSRCEGDCPVVAMYCTGAGGEPAKDEVFWDPDLLTNSRPDNPPPPPRFESSGPPPSAAAAAAAFAVPGLRGGSSSRGGSAQAASRGELLKLALATEKRDRGGLSCPGGAPPGLDSGLAPGSAPGPAPGSAPGSAPG